MIFNTWGRRYPWADCLSDWSTERKRDGLAWRAPGQQVRVVEGGSRVQRERGSLLNRVEACQWQAEDPLNPPRPIIHCQSLCCHSSLRWCCTLCRHHPPEAKTEGRREKVATERSSKWNVKKKKRLHLKIEMIRYLGRLCLTAAAADHGK